MGWFDRFKLFRASPENPSTSLANPAAWLFSALGAVPSASGVSVNEQSALGNTAVLQAIRLLAQTVGVLPLHLYAQQTNGDKERIRSGSLAGVLDVAANDEMTAQTFRETITGHAVGWGNGYAEIQFNGRGEVVALWPLTPDRVTVERKDGRRIYWVMMPGRNERVALDPSRVLHIAGFGFDGLVGYSPIKLCRDAIGLAMAAEKFGSALFANGARPSGVLTHPKSLSKVAKENLRDSWEQVHSGLTNQQRLAILEEGLTYTATQINPDDAQFLQTRQLQVTEVARVFGVPPHLLQDLSRSTFSNIEHQGIEFVTHTIQPWLVRWEQQVLLKCIPERQANLVAEFQRNALLRGDTLARFQAYQIGRQNGWLSPNEIRQLENMNSRPGGDEFQETPVGGAPNEAPKEEPPPAKSEEPDPEPSSSRARQALRASARIGVADVLRRAGRREAQVVRAAIKRRTGPSAVYPEHREYVARALEPILASYAAGVTALHDVEDVDSVALRMAADAIAKAWCDQWSLAWPMDLTALEARAQALEADGAAGEDPLVHLDAMLAGLSDVPLQLGPRPEVRMLPPPPAPLPPSPIENHVHLPTPQWKTVEYDFLRNDQNVITGARARLVKEA